MAFRNLRLRNRSQSAVEMAIAAVEDSPLPSPLDQDMRSIGESPCDLDLPAEQPCRRSGTVPIRLAVANDEQSGEAIQ
jgi:hypothetical protein